MRVITDNPEFPQTFVTLDACGDYLDIEVRFDGSIFIEHECPDCQRFNTTETTLQELEQLVAHTKDFIKRRQEHLEGDDEQT